MYKISLVSSSIKLGEDAIENFEHVGGTLTVFPRGVEINQLLESDGILLEENNQEDISYICSLLLSMKEKKKPLIWILSNQQSVINRQVYLQIGVDGVLDKEWFPEEVSLTVRNAFLRFKKEEESNQNLLSKTTSLYEKNQCQLNMENQSVLLTASGQKKEIELTKLEFKAFELLTSNPTKVFSYEEIYEHLWGKTYTGDKYRIANIMFHIRGKIKWAGKDQYIRTIRSVGYRLDTSHR